MGYIPKPTLQFSLFVCCPAGSRRSVYIQSTLKRRPGYRTLERDLIQLQQQQLFQIFVVVSLRKGSPGNTYSPEITQQFPKMVRKGLLCDPAYLIGKDHSCNHSVLLLNHFLCNHYNFVSKIESC